MAHKKKAHHKEMKSCDGKMMHHKEKKAVGKMKAHESMEMMKEKKHAKKK